MKRYFKTIKAVIYELKYAILTSVIIASILLFPLPYYIYSPGGIDNIEPRYEIENKYKSSGSFNLVYIKASKATVMFYLPALIMPSWELVKYSDVILENEDLEDDLNRDDLYLKEATQNAIINAYKKAGKEYKIIKTHKKVFYISEDAKNGLKVADELVMLDDVKFSEDSLIDSYMKTKTEGEKVKLKIIRDNKPKTVNGEILLHKGDKKIGIVILPVYEFKTDPNIKIKFPKNQSGPSAGLILALSIYDSLTKEDLTKGYKITGTGTIDETGNVGAIGEIEKKLQSAIKAKSDIFLAPLGDNYDDAKKIAKKNNYEIIIIPIETFDDAITYLNKLTKK